MSFDPQRLRDYRFAPVHQHLTQRDLMLYALGVGFGADPLDAGQLRYVYEDGLRAVPTMAITLGYPNTLREFAAATGIRAEMVLHVSQNFTLHRPLPLQGDLVGQTVVTGIYDKGPGRGMLWTYRNRGQRRGHRRGDLRPGRRQHGTRPRRLRRRQGRATGERPGSRPAGRHRV